MIFSKNSLYKEKLISLDLTLKETNDKINCLQYSGQ